MSETDKILEATASRDRLYGGLGRLRVDFKMMEDKILSLIFEAEEELRLLTSKGESDEPSSDNT